jgi:ABC-2 type transport system ATP-binding protein
VSEPALELCGLRKTFPGFALGPIDLRVPVGAIYGFVGPNGAGKSTTIDLIFGMGAKDDGAIQVLGMDHLRDEVRVKQQVAYVGPDLDFRSWRRVDRAIRFVKGFYPGWDDAYCDRLLRTFGLEGHQPIATLSFGSRTKLALVLALARRPALLVLDEPTVGLDAIAKQQMFAELLAAVRDGERTVFISSHAIADLERFADHVGLIKHGRMVFEGTTSDIVERYRIVDVDAAITAPLEQAPGVYVQARDDRRWRVLLDMQQSSIDRLKSRGALPIADAPVSLEDLFVALGRD